MGWMREWCAVCVVVLCCVFVVVQLCLVICCCCCVRFHVLCSHHLCEEEITTFDPKMNSENLNKCLLSLKELYRDLRLGQVRGCG